MRPVARPPCRERANVSIHAPREGCDDQGSPSSSTRSPFQFTHPGRGATPRPRRVSSPRQCFNSRTPGGVRRTASQAHHLFDGVSIHAPREGCDTVVVFLQHIVKAFQFTHPGRGATTGSGDPLPRLPSFNSRTPGGVRRLCFSRSSRSSRVSIHAPREGCDVSVIFVGLSPRSFNSRTPGGVRLHFTSDDLLSRPVSIHAPREGCDG